MKEGGEGRTRTVDCRVYSFTSSDHAQVTHQGLCAPGTLSQQNNVVARVPHHVPRFPIPSPLPSSPPHVRSAPSWSPTDTPVSARLPRLSTLSTSSSLHPPHPPALPLPHPLLPASECKMYEYYQKREIPPGGRLRRGSGQSALPPGLRVPGITPRARDSLPMPLTPTTPRRPRQQSLTAWAPGQSGRQGPPAGTT